MSKLSYFLVATLCFDSGFINTFLNIQINTTAAASDWGGRPARKLHFQSRCTRRYTPGACAEAVAEVWTYAFHILNCTQRMGCPRGDRTNRFSSYARCISRCHRLGELYEQLLEVDGLNETDFAKSDRQDVAAGRREGSIGDMHYIEAEDKEEYDETDKWLNDPQLSNFYRHIDDGANLEDIQPRNIDEDTDDHISNTYEDFWL